VSEENRSWPSSRTSLEKGSEDYAPTEREVQMLEARLLPDVIIAHKGAIAARQGSNYSFFIAGNTDTKKDAAPGLVTLVSYVLRHLNHEDPVLKLMKLDERYEELGSLRHAAHDLFREVMAPRLDPDEDSPPLEFGESSPETDAPGSSPGGGV
jgi:hypothetical protein